MATSSSLTFDDHDRIDHEWLDRWNTVCRRVRIACGVECWNRRIETFRHLTEEGVVRWEVHTIVSGDDEELTSVRVGSGIGHCN